MEANTIKATLSDYSVIAFTTNAQEEFKQVTIKTIDAYCSAYSRACVTIRIEEVSSSEETTSCIIISSIESNSDGVTEVSFFVITGDGSARGILPFDVMKDAVEAGVSNGDYESSGFRRISFSESTTSESGRSQALSTSAVVGITITLIVFVILAVLIVAVVMFIVYKGKHSKQYEIGDNVLGNRSVLAFSDSLFKGDGGITNMVALDKDENMAFEDDNNDDTMEEPVSSSVF